MSHGAPVSPLFCGIKNISYIYHLYKMPDVSEFWSFKEPDKYAGNYMPNTTNAMNVNFNNGNANNNDKTNNNYVRCVRAGAWDLFSFKNIYRAYLKCRKRKRSTINALRFEMRLEDNLCMIEKELKAKKYQPLRSVCFFTKKPKLREIFAADFKDRIIHHLLVDYLEKIYEPIFIYDSWACRKNKGTMAAVKRIRKFINSITLNNTTTAYYIQLDIKSFFVNINKNILKSIIRKKIKIKNEDILWLVDVILDNDCTKNYILKGDPSLLSKIPPHKTLFNSPKHKGIPIGNLTSQFFANVYLNELDQFIKHKLKVRYYLRYVDDFVLMSRNKDELIKWKNEIEVFLKNNLDLELNFKTEKLKKISDGIDFLGYIIKPKYILVRKRVVSNCKSKLKYFSKNIKSFMPLTFNPEIVNSVSQCVSSYFAHFKYANSYNLVVSLKKKFFFIDEYLKCIKIVFPHHFNSIYAQYEFFKKYLSDKEIMFFEVGLFYKFFDEQAIKAANIFNLRIFEEKNKKICGFPVYMENKYLKIALNNNYSVLIVKQFNKWRFNYKLMTRTLLFKYLVLGNGGVYEK